MIHFYPKNTLLTLAILPVFTLSLSLPFFNQDQSWITLFHQTEALYQQGNYKKAFKVGNQAFSEARNNLQSDDAGLAEVEYLLGKIGYALGRFETASELYRSAQLIWDILLDPATLAAVIPGCHGVEKISDTHFRADVTLGIGPVKGRYRAEVKLSDLDPPRAVTLSGSAEGGLGFGNGEGRITLRPRVDDEREHAAEGHHAALVALLHEALVDVARRGVGEVDDHGCLQVRPSRAIISSAEAGPHEPAGYGSGLPCLCQ